jgi:hypothetical protein
MIANIYTAAAGVSTPPLVVRILESGMPVYGFGEKKTPSAFVYAC